ncbi:MAG: hypothetical protein ABGY96_10265, partial [bacterium]
TIIKFIRCFNYDVVEGNDSDDASYLKPESLVARIAGPARGGEVERLGAPVCRRQLQGRSRGGAGGCETVR